ncbi:MAG TPA: hypothetical protein VEM13_09620 [Gemmatimonadales bacterium]|nr:hypothetical protein [Gemmatimonadales bacterium]
MSTPVRFASFLLAATAAVACPGPYATRPAPFGALAVDTISIAAIRAYAATLHFDTVLGAADAQRLSVARLVGHDTLKVNGPLARIAPESSAYSLDSTALAQGRIIARIWSDSTYDKAGLRRGVNWWWVDRRGGVWRSVIISDSAGSRTPRPLYIHNHGPRYRWQQSIARFVWLDSDEQLWGTCGWSNCCATSPALE